MPSVPVTDLMGIIARIRQQIVTDYRGNRAAVMPLQPDGQKMPPNKSDWVMPLMSLTAGGDAADTPCAALRYRYTDADDRDCGRASIEILDRMPKTAYDIQSSDSQCPPVQLLLLSVGKYIQGETGHEDRYTTLLAVFGKSWYAGGFNYVEYREYAPLVISSLALFNEAVAKLPADVINFRESLRTFEDA